MSQELATTNNITKRRLVIETLQRNNITCHQYRGADFLNQYLNGQTVEVTQRQSLSQLAQFVTLNNPPNTDERFHEQLWSMVRLKQMLPDSLMGPPYFVWTPRRCLQTMDIRSRTFVIYDTANVDQPTR